jgi:hypothetical protein
VAVPWALFLHRVIPAAIQQGIKVILMASLAVVVAGRCAAGFRDAWLPIATERPAVTASSASVPSGALQVESGWAVTSSHGLLVSDVPEVLMRFGGWSKTELRLTAPNFFTQSVGQSGLGDLGVRVKHKLGRTSSGFDVSLMFFRSAYR